MSGTELSRMTLAELAAYIGDRLDNGPPFTQDEKWEMHDYLGRKIAWAGALWDRVDGIDPNNGLETKYGTRNRKSMTYKTRKLAGYSYP